MYQENKVCGKVFLKSETLEFKALIYLLLFKFFYFGQVFFFFFFFKFTFIKYSLFPSQGM